MDMQKEVRSFESEFPAPETIQFNERFGFYESVDSVEDARHQNILWKGWLACAKASAVPEEFRVVGLEFLKEINRIAVDEFHKWDLKKEPMPPICEHLQDLSYYITNGKVMIEAQEQSE